MRLQRNIIHIDESKCDGCGLCVRACAEGALRIVNGKAKLVSETYCDGLGACLGECPRGAIRIETREAEMFDEKATEKHQHKQKVETGGESKPGAERHVCPGSMVRKLNPRAAQEVPGQGSASQLGNWPVQLALAPVNAPYFQGAELLLAADCVPLALADFHNRFLRGKPVIIGCPKLDDPEAYGEKLGEILARNEIVSLTVVHMEVPCCGGLTRIAQAALARCGKEIPMKDFTISIGGEVLQERATEASICTGEKR